MKCDFFKALVAISVFAGCSSTQAEDSARAVYQWMQQLQGEWVLSPAEVQEGSKTRDLLVAPMFGTDQVAMSFRMVGASSTVVENLLPGTAKEMVTMYHCEDGGCSRVRATHYCTKQNQPQMTARVLGESGVVFDCDMDTELCQSWDDHVHRITHELSADGSHLKTTYSAFINGEHKGDSIYHFDKKM